MRSDVLKRRMIHLINHWERMAYLCLVRNSFVTAHGFSFYHHSSSIEAPQHATAYRLWHALITFTSHPSIVSPEGRVETRNIHNIPFWVNRNQRTLHECRQPAVVAACFRLS
ncbi:hypothetical protein BJX68DRAFT_10154 [Aspergillus pseudodeflectus]|uniref:Uncharacterized protein n=1 Tax=Aspergillus pseudodeflectus TaxID=176178 RepID=A0ABR4LB51_9EURO